jgi:diguanylate cyclase (GGDEF)-like protein
METFSAFKDLTQIHDGDNSRVYRARRVEDGRSLILKVLKADYPTTDQIGRYKQEYHLTHQLQLPSIIKAYGLEEWQRTLVMIVEDFGGISIDQWLQLHQQELTVDEFLPLALKIVDGLAQLHSQNVIHKDINPTNIVFNPETGVVKLIDLGISTQLSRENLTLNTPNALEGTLNYLSPEQTGRMNRSLDYRTDFYSLGVTFYELLTGALPFTTPDPMELVHCHIAKQPVPPHLLGKQEIPQAISDLIVKLMAKNVEDRYQSAMGLKADLEVCLVQWQKTGAIAPFALGSHDISDQLQIPQKLYGREVEIEMLLATFERVAAFSASSSQVELILVTGYSGIGKSCLVQELYKPITAKRGYFISGKFDQFQRNIPYSAVVNAFTGLVKQLLGEPEVALKQWRDRLLAALASNGQVVIDIIPEVELIIGAQPEVPSLGANESQNRFNLVFQRFIQAFCNSEHPLTIFLDDLQWADLATLNLIERLLGKGKIDNLLLIGAYRDHEVSESHPLALTLAQLDQKGANLQTITLAPLRLEHVGQLIAETLHSHPQSVNGLAELVMRKTEGNPFFVNEFLQTLHSENLLAFDRTAGQWHWDLAQIEAVGFTNNVVEMMVGQLQKLPPSVQKVLSLTACLGSEFDLETIALVEDRIDTEVFVDLKTATERRFLLPRSPLDQNLLIQNYQFGHDRIQQAAYSLIPASERASVHYRIGKSLRRHLSPTALEEKFFAVVNQLNYGIDLIEGQVERDELAKLNLTACRKARMAIAYQAAGEYAAIGLNLLGSEAWQRQYETTLALHELAAEVALLCGKFDQMERWVDATSSHARTPLEQVGVYSVKIQALSIQDQLSEAISVGQSILMELGIQLPNPPSSEDIQQVVQEINSLIGDRPIEDLFHLPAMLDVEKLAIMQIAAAIGPACFMLGSPLFPSLITLLVNLSLQYGNSPASGYGYACYGLFLNSFLQDAIAASQFGQLAYRLATNSDAKSMRSETFSIIGFFLHHRQAHLRETLPILKAGYQAGLEAGNLGFVGHNGNGFCMHSFCCGEPLAELENQLRSYHQQFLDHNQLMAASYCSIYWEITLFLLGNSDAIEFPFSQDFDKENQFSQSFAAKNPTGVFQFYLFKAVLRFLLGDMAMASADIVRIRPYIPVVVETITEAVFYFYDSLIVLATLPELDTELETQWQQVQANQARLHHWAEHAPMNYLHKWQLVEAETCRSLGQKLEAIELYDMAIAGAKEHQYIQEEALANELAAKFYLDWGKQTIAHTYMVEAHYCYQSWGAIAKVTQLDTQYPQLLQSQGVFSPRATSNTGNSSSSALDLATLIKSSQAIATEIVLEKLLQTLMRILLENAGAQTGCLLLHTPSGSGELGTFKIVARSHSEYNSASIAQFIDSLRDTLQTPLPYSVINYVARTRDLFLLDNAVDSVNFSHDPYMQSVKPLSVLCYPLLDQGNLVGIVYLENNLTTGVFTSDRIELLQVISAQAAIAIENAILYAEKAEYTNTLEQKVSDRTAELQHANLELLKLANIDGLTQIPNRRNFDRYLAEEWQRHLREQQPLALILIDIDYFKSYNDHYGHQCGDDCLIQVAQAIAKIPQRPTDLVARYGGEEFVTILSNTSAEGALIVAKSIRKAIADLGIPHFKSEVSNYITLSLGIASLIPTPDKSLEDLIANADRALYAAKRKGRDRAIAYGI